MTHQQTVMDAASLEKQPGSGATARMMGTWYIPAICLACLSGWIPALQADLASPPFLFWLLPFLGGAVGGYHALTAARATRHACWAAFYSWAIWMGVNVLMPRLRPEATLFHAPWALAYSIYLFPYLLPLLFVGAFLGGLAATLAGRAA